MAAWLVTLGACMAEAPDPAPAPADETPAATSTIIEDELVLPDITPVYECSVTGRWWGTRAICQANCAGGTCFLCSLSCQN